ncbi:sensor histidine kinase [Brevundimonas sp. R86498]|uniref:sensor histidine kinase n=1 Tax=Brevundimonas sp. R86498 TaxID=3093845 RepID=UPI0037CAD1B5
MFPVAVYIKSKDGAAHFHNGTLFPVPIELRDIPRLSQYAKIENTGWSAGEFGYWRYCHALPTGDLLIVPGLILADVKRPSKRYPGYSQEWSRDQIQQFAIGISSYALGVIESAQEDLNLLVHDLRALSNAIYNSALEAQSWVEKSNYTEVRKRLDNVIASQAMLKMRTDALDFVGNPASLIQDSKIHAFRKIDKVIRCFKSSALFQRKVINLNGNSFGRVKGPEIFELIPYVLIDNAIKYSPEMYPIEVSVSESDGLEFSVESYGPFISQDEQEEIFRKGVRGRSAIASGAPGSGVGLSLAKKLVEDHFSGNVRVDQEIQSDFVDGFYYHKTRFTVRMPLVA